MIGGVALQRAERELQRVQVQHERAERERDSHRLEAGYRRGLEWAFHALGDLTATSGSAPASGRRRSNWTRRAGAASSSSAGLKEPAQQRLIGERVGELRQRDQRLLRELQQERDELGQVREMRQELARCPEQQRELKLKGRGLEARELIRDDGLKREIGADARATPGT